MSLLQVVNILIHYMLYNICSADSIKLYVCMMYVLILPFLTRFSCKINCLIKHFLYDKSRGNMYF